jgi:hypothetical protein
MMNPAIAILGPVCTGKRVEAFASEDLKYAIQLLIVVRSVADRGPEGGMSAGLPPLPCRTFQSGEFAGWPGVTKPFCTHDCSLVSIGWKLLWQLTQELVIICIESVNLTEDWAKVLGVEIARTTVIRANAFLRILVI